MKKIAAFIIALLGMAIFPFNSRILLTDVGLLFAGMSAALMFLAYRLATHSKKE